MDNDRNLLKVFGIFAIILGVLNIAIIFGGAEPVYAYVASGVFNILLGVLLLLTVKDPAKAGFAMVLAVIDLVLTAAGLILTVIGGEISVSAIVDLLFIVIVVLALRRIQKQGK